jgi:hypothetical protein
MFIPMDIIYYIWLFDPRYVFRNSKWYIINRLNLTNYASLLDKPLIVPRLFDGAIFGYMVHFKNPAYQLIYTKLLIEEEEVHRIIFEKTTPRIYGMVHFIK